MIRSMTGYGYRQATWGNGTVTVEIRSVNHRFREIAVHLPRGLARLEDSLKAVIQRRCARGRIDLTVSVSGLGAASTKVSLDHQVARQYRQVLDQLRRECRLMGSPDLGLLAGLKGVISVEEQPVVDQRLSRLITRLVTSAVTDLDRMRRREGMTLAAQLYSGLAAIEDALKEIAARRPVAVQAYYERMKERLSHLIPPERLDSARLEQELAIFADRCDISEELTRLKSHLREFRSVLKRRQPVGKTLEFLLQEMGREVNTIGSKANDSLIAQQVVRIKGDLEKLREQVLNIQ
jgi:uncharacterized protein (TIGR00255 family)